MGSNPIGAVSFKMASENQYDKKAAEYMDTQKKFYSDKEDGSRKNLYEMLDFLLEGKKVLDVGCGFGKDLAYFKKKGAIIYGIDSSEEMIKLAKENNPDIDNISLQSFEKTDFADDFFDLVFSRYALHYADDIDKGYKEMHRILKSGGYMIILVSHPLLSFVAKKDRNYYKKEKVKVPIYGGSCILEWWSKRITDFLSPFLLENFDLLKLFEEEMDDARNEDNFPELVPDYMILKLRKR